MTGRLLTKNLPVKSWGFC